MLRNRKKVRNPEEIKKETEIINRESQESIPLDTLSPELIQHIADFLPFNEVKLNLSLTSSFFFKTLDHVYDRRRCQLSGENIDSIFSAALNVIDQYFLKDKPYSGYYNDDDEEEGRSVIFCTSILFCTGVSFDQWYHRAFCLRQILRNSSLDKNIHLFAIYVILDDRDKNKLTSRLLNDLNKKWGDAIFPAIEKHLKAVFRNKLADMVQMFRQKICYDSASDNRSYDDQADVNSDYWKTFFDELLLENQNQQDDDLTSYFSLANAI